MSVVRMLHFLKDQQKLFQIHQYYTMALILYLSHCHEVHSGIYHRHASYIKNIGQIMNQEHQAQNIFLHSFSHQNKILYIRIYM